jgi:hypothetical protein
MFQFEEFLIKKSLKRVAEELNVSSVEHLNHFTSLFGVVISVMSAIGGIEIGKSFRLYSDLLTYFIEIFGERFKTGYIIHKFHTFL